jgi:hypothetical protein
MLAMARKKGGNAPRPGIYTGGSPESWPPPGPRPWTRPVWRWPPACPCSLRAVQIDHGAVYVHLLRGVQAYDLSGDHVVDVFHGLEHALAQIAFFVAVPELHSLVLARAGAGGHGSAAYVPSSKITSTSIVGFPRESRISRALRIRHAHGNSFYGGLGRYGGGAERARPMLLLYTESVSIEEGGVNGGLQRDGLAPLARP